MAAWAGAWERPLPGDALTPRGSRFAVMLGKLALGLVLGAAVLANAVSAQAATKAEQAAAAPKPASIDRNGVLILIRSTLLALDHANKTGNYTVLRDLGAPGFQQYGGAPWRDLRRSAPQQSRSVRRRRDRSATQPPAADRGERLHAARRIFSVDPAAGQFRDDLCAGRRPMAAVRLVGRARTERVGRPSPAGGFKTARCAS